MVSVSIYHEFELVDFVRGVFLFHEIIILLMRHTIRAIFDLCWAGGAGEGSGGRMHGIGMG